MTIERYFELQDKLLSYENALRYYGMEEEAKKAISIVNNLFKVIDNKDLENIEQYCIDFLAKHKSIRDRFDIECT